MDCYREVDIEEVNEKYDTHIAKRFDEPTNDDVVKYTDMIYDILAKAKDYRSMAQFTNLKRKYNFAHKNSFLFRIFQIIKDEQQFTEEDEDYLRDVLRIKMVKSHSGVISVTIFTSGNPTYTDPDTGEVVTQTFSCKWNCAYCPNEPGQPRSYLKGEPGVLRANRANFDCVEQMHARMDALFLTGHPIDKLEVIVLGGTWASYPLQYREEFIRDMYYAANTYGTISPRRERQSLSYEREQNKDAKCKVIGLTLETRPDTVTPDEIALLRHYGCTRVQLGIQHIDDEILKKIRRQCTTEQTKRAIRLLKDAGFKVDGHWMPNLPGASKKLDDWMFNDRLLGIDKKTYQTVSDDEIWELYDMRCPEFQLDQWKVYPCTVVPWTDIEKWFKEGTYVQYPQEDMMDVILKMKALMLPWIRLNRIIRDIPSDYVYRSDYKSNLRQDMLTMLKEDGFKCHCIRCREVKEGQYKDGSQIMVVRKYNGSDGTEYFISFESRDQNILYGFVRLRIQSSHKNQVFSELDGAALVRELHVYGRLQEVGKNKDGCTQHKGLGKKLMAKAEEIAKQHGCNKMSVISGEGTRGYYEKIGYHQDLGAGRFMMKEI